jgi:diguanylate cyclase (GGDEF)-like protein
LGAVVPLVALGALLDRYVLSSPALLEGHLTRPFLVSLFSLVALLSLVSFVLLRQLVRVAAAGARSMVHFDPLTGLPNRRMYCERAEQALRRAAASKSPLAICFLDLDGFKTVNDTLGHRIGDALLREVAKRLVDGVRLSDTVARLGGSPQTAVSRLGGDEFTLLLSGFKKPDDIRVVANRILEILRSPFLLDLHEISVTASMGIAIYPSDGDDLETLLANADAAMYSAKDHGRDTYEFFSVSMNQTVHRRRCVEDQLRRALRENGFALHYQPIHRVDNGRIAHGEALLRWTDSKLGLSPSEFIPVAEETGLIVPIGEWVLRTACRDARRWAEQAPYPCRLSVNVSGVQLRDPSFSEMVADSLRESGLPAEMLVLELTESAIMQKHCAACLQDLRDQGVSIILDDFGTGYSSLGYLTRLPIDSVKIDKAFISHLPDSPRDIAVAGAIVSLARELNLSVVAEGVETAAQAHLLRELGADGLQGNLLGCPVPLEEFEKLLPNPVSLPEQDAAGAATEPPTRSRPPGQVMPDLRSAPS